MWAMIEKLRSRLWGMVTMPECSGSGVPRRMLVFGQHLATDLGKRDRRPRVGTLGQVLLGLAPSQPVEVEHVQGRAGVGHLVGAGPAVGGHEVGHLEDDGVVRPGEPPLRTIW